MIVKGDTAGRQNRIRFADFICAVIGHQPSETQAARLTEDGKAYRTRYCTRCWRWGYLPGDMASSCFSEGSDRDEQTTDSAVPPS